MIEMTQLSHLKDLLDRSHQIVIIYPTAATVDQVASARALAESLLAEGKDVRLCVPELSQEFQLESDSIDQPSIEIGNQNLTISFNYNPEQVDKVSYHIGEETKKFYLTIKPKKGQPPLDTQSVEFSYTGASADLIITIGVSNLEDLMQLYFGYEDMYKETTIWSIHTYDTTFGAEKLNISQYSSFSEAIERVINDLGLSLSGNQATNLLAGIDDVTQGFRSLATTAETFESVARLLRAGGRRKRATTPTIQPKNSAIFTAAPATNTVTQLEPQYQELSVQSDPSNQQSPMASVRNTRTTKPKQDKKKNDFAEQLAARGEGRR